MSQGEAGARAARELRVVGAVVGVGDARDDDGVTEAGEAGLGRLAAAEPVLGRRSPGAAARPESAMEGGILLGCTMFWGCLFNVEGPEELATLHQVRVRLATDRRHPRLRDPGPAGPGPDAPRCFLRTVCFLYFFGCIPSRKIHSFCVISILRRRLVQPEIRRRRIRRSRQLLGRFR